MNIPPSADILAVDDDAQILRALDRTLREEGYLVRTATTVVSALDVLRTTRFALLLLDVQMPLQGGLELARCVRGGGTGPMNRDVPIVFVTADESIATFEATFDVAAFRCVYKPLFGNALRHVVGTILHAA